MNKSITASYIITDFEKQIVLRANHLIRTLNSQMLTLDFLGA